MAKKHLEQYDKNGNKLDIYLNEDEVMVGDQTLADKLSDMEEAIDEAGSGDGTVTGVKVGSTTYEPTDGVVDLSTPFGGKVDKNGTDSLMTAAEHTKLQNLPTNEQLIQQFGTKANDADVVKSISVNGGTAQTPTNGNVNIQVQAGEQVSVIQPATPDGTFTIRVGSTDYTINLNHTHENMAKLIVCQESDLPSTLANDTIYAIKGLGNTSIDKLIIQGLEFVGGGGSSEMQYDAEIEYLQSTGTQYIDTGVVGSTDFACEIKAEFTENQEGYDTLLGAYTSSAAFAIALAIRNATVTGVGAKNAAYAQFGDDAAAAQGGNASPLVVSSVSTLGLHIYKSALQNGIISVDVDGTLLSKTYNGGAPSLLSMYLFARNRQDNGVGNFSKAKIYYCRIWSGGSLVRSFIPVRVGQVGYMYDQISGRLFGNSGSGDFTLGNDKQNN